MDKLTYLAELAEGLSRWVPERERQDILRYYAEYFEEAGPQREAEVIRELGDPWALSCRLAVEGGFVSQEQADHWTPRKRKRWPWIALGVTAAVLALIAVPVALFSQVVGSFVGGNVASFIRGEQTAVVEEVDKAQFGTVREDAVYVESEEGDGGFWSMEDGYLEPFHEIDVDVSIGNVTVTEGDDYTLYISSNTTLGGYSLRWEVKDGKLKIRDSGSAGHVNITSWDDFKNMFGIDASAMDVVITVPETGDMANKIKVKTGLGDVFLSNLYVAEKVEAETGLGDVQCYEVRAYDEVDLETGLGDVTLGVGEVFIGAKFDLKTGLGTIEAQMGSLEKNWDIEAKTGMGTVTLNGDSRGTKLERKGAGDYELEAETGMGDVNLYFQEDRW
ncbi:MAG: DUF4097 family beta strand repeat-containing protein [Oscillospiraceae bacterium]|nr:DUF4097 family beta strand repeat-containing protein [Oscillospiraceae bacterium]